MDKYADVKKQLEDKGFETMLDAFVVGSLGTWDPKNNHLLHMNAKVDKIWTSKMDVDDQC